jgi:hypothetical protein
VPLLFNFALEYTIKKVQGNQVGLKLNGTHQLLAYADNVNLLKITQILLKKIQKPGLEEEENKEEEEENKELHIYGPT